MWDRTPLRRARERTDGSMPDVRRQDAAVAAATTVWRSHGAPMVLPLTVAMPAIHGARLCDSRWPRLSLLDETS